VSFLSNTSIQFQTDLFQTLLKFAIHNNRDQFRTNSTHFST